MSTRAATRRLTLCLALFALIELCNATRAAADLEVKAEAEEEEEVEVRWRSVPTHGADFGLTAIAFDPASNRIAAGSTRGLYQGDASGVFDLVEARSEVRDLAFLAAEAEPPVLFAATNRGVYRIAAEGSSGPLAPGPGGGARDVYRIAVAARSAGVAVATAGGAFLSRDGRHWDRLSPTHPTGPVTAIALRAHGLAGAGLECFTLFGGTLWRTIVDGREEGGAARSQRETIPFAPQEEARDVVVGLPGSDLVVVYASALAVRSRGEGGFGSDPSPSVRGGWEILRPALPPGAKIARVAAALGRFWLATDRGLLEAASLAGPWRRASAPAGSANVRALVGGPETLYIASETRLLRAEVIDTVHAGAASREVASSPEPALRAEPRIQDLHRAAIAYVTLTRERMDGMHSRVGKRGWLPVVSLRAQHDRDRDWDTDRDQTFTYGELHDLVDRGNGHNIGTGVSLTLSWDLGDVVYHPEEIDVSREVRSLLALRDDILDELTQMYFDRKRVLVKRAALPKASVEAAQLQLRADELAAGMDAWTGGWFSRALRGLGPSW